MAALRIALLGPLQVTLDGAPVTGFEYTKVRALLAYLAAGAGRSQTRAELCALLWPDLPEPTARRNLTQAFTALRRALREAGSDAPWLLIEGESAQLDPTAGLDVDTRRFEALLAEAERHPHRSWHTCSPCADRLRAAVALYRGDFLGQLFVADSAPFEEWALLWRERLRQRVFSALERLAQNAEWRDDYGAAVAFVRRQVELDPLREAGHRELMRLLALDGQRAAAGAQYEFLQRTLRAELGVEPEAETALLHERIRAGQPGTLRRYAAPPVNGPEPPNPLVGREEALQAVYDRLRDSGVRALTVTGMPGIGKTRLALQAAHSLRYEFEDGVHFVDLALVAEAASVAPAIVQALGVKERTGQTPAAALAAWLKPAHVLLVLDNFEHLLDAAALVAELLAAAPAVKALITSRAPLRIRAEQQYALAPLAEAEAVQLFVERARAARPTFALTAEAEAAVAALCAQLDYLPLAIELIAVRAKTFSLDDLCRQLAQPLDALAHGARDLPDRHRTLRDAIYWSFDRLSLDEQRVFAHLGVFAGGATAEAAQAVLGTAPPALPALEALVEASLVQAHLVAGETRFTLLKTIREFALEQLTARGEAEAVQQRHADYVQRLAEAAYEQLLGPNQAAWSARMAAELDNVRAAIRWANRHHRVETCLRIATGMFRFCWQRGLVREALGWFETALQDRTAVPLDVQSRAFRAAGILASGLNDYALARQWLEEAINTGRQAGDAYAFAAAHTNLGLALEAQGEWELACARLSEAIALHHTLVGQPHAVKFPLQGLASVYLRLGRFSEAEPLFQESLAHNRALGDVEGTANSLYGLAVAVSGRGDFQSARELADEALRLYRGLDHQYGLANTHAALGDILREAQDYDAAAAHYQQSLRIWVEREDAVWAANVLEAVGLLLASRGRWRSIARLLGAAASMRENAHAALTPHEESQRQAVLTACRAALGDAAFEAASAAGRALTLEQVGALAFE
jgi:predicted ATPase/DNA-binding SARP family transcriptional activator